MFVRWKANSIEEPETAGRTIIRVVKSLEIREVGSRRVIVPINRTIPRFVNLSH